MTVWVGTECKQVKQEERYEDKTPDKTRTVKLKLKISAGERRSAISRMISWGNEPANFV